MLVLKTKYQKLSGTAFAPNGRGLAAAGQHGAYWWSSVFDEPKAVKFGEGQCGGVGFTLDGGHLITLLSGTGLCSIELSTRLTRAVPVEGFEPSAVVCPATGRIVVERWNGGEMTGWQIGPDGGPNILWRVRAEVGSIGSGAAFAPDGSWFVRTARMGEEWQGYRFVLHDAVTGEALPSASLERLTWVSCGPAISPDKQWIAYATQNFLFAQSLSDPKQRKTAKNDNTHQFTGLAFHPSGRFLAATNNDATVKLYDTTTWEVVRTFTWDIGRMRSIAFSPDGTLAAAGSDSGKVVIWDLDF